MNTETITFCCACNANPATERVCASEKRSEHSDRHELANCAHEVCAPCKKNAFIRNMFQTASDLKTAAVLKEVQTYMDCPICDERVCAIYWFDPEEGRIGWDFSDSDDDEEGDSDDEEEAADAEDDAESDSDSDAASDSEDADAEDSESDSDSDSDDDSEVAAAEWALLVRIIERAAKAAADEAAAAAADEAATAAATAA